MMILSTNLLMPMLRGSCVSNCQLPNAFLEANHNYLRRRSKSVSLFVGINKNVLIPMCKRVLYPRVECHVNEVTTADIFHRTKNICSILARPDGLLPSDQILRLISTVLYNPCILSMLRSHVMFVLNYLRCGTSFTFKIFKGLETFIVQHFLTSNCKGNRIPEHHENARIRVSS